MTGSAALLVGEKRFIGSLGGSCAPDIDFPVFVGRYKSGELELDSLVQA